MSELSASDNASNDGQNEIQDQRQAMMASMGRDFSSYTHDGNFCVYFKLVRNRREAEEGIKADVFRPDFVHQFFLNSERIFGYKKPMIHFFYTASRLKRYFSFSYEDKLSIEQDRIPPDDIIDALKPVLEDLECTQDLNEFIGEVESDEEKKFMPPGELMLEFEKPYNVPPMLSRAELEALEMAGENLPTNGTSSNSKTSSLNGSSHNGSSAPSNSSSSHAATVPKADREKSPPSSTTKRYRIYYANRETKNFEQFQARMQTLIMWFIESATMIDFNDQKWDFFLIFERYNPATSQDPNAVAVSTEDRYYFAGYATVYRYYAYPNKVRPRVSQMLILPPYRRNRLGTSLLQTIYDFYKKQPATLDITAEDPDEDFISIRDFLDCKNVIEKLPSFSPEKLKKGWSMDMAREAQENLKLCHRQARKIYEILKLRIIENDDSEELRNYRLEIKNRLNIPNRRLKLDCDKVEKRGYELPEEMRIQRDNQRLTLEALEENYQECLKQYTRTIRKLDRIRT